MRLSCVSSGCVALLVLSLAVAARPAAAQTAAAAHEGKAPAPAGPLRVWVDAPAAPLDVERLRESLSRELGREVVLLPDAAEANVLIRLPREGRVEVRYTTPGGEQLTREVELPPDRERSLQVVSWLTVNLVRDEASELLDELRARRKAEAEARAAEEKAAAERAAADKAAAESAAAAKARADAARAEAARKAAAAAAAARAKPAPLLRDPLRSFDFALATPISLLRDSPKRELTLQVALAFGDSGAIRGVGASMMALRIRRDLNGAAAAPGLLWIGADVRGAASSIGYARVEGRLDGVAVAGGFASANQLQGALVAGGATLVRAPSQGLLLAGGANISGDFQGLQLSGGVNVARDFQGIALAPINVQRRVRGLQIGVINVDDQVDGVAIGIITLSRDGRLQPVLWGSGDQSLHVALKSIAGYAFTQLGGGVDLNGARVSYDGGIGAHIRLPHGFFLEPGVHYSHSQSTGDPPSEQAAAAPDEQDLYYLVGAGLRVGEKLDMLLGAGLKHRVVGGTGDRVAPEVRAGIGFF